MGNRRTSLQDLIAKRQQREFIGRAEQIEHFRQNLSLPWDDERRLFIFNIWGHGGVGKSTLLRQFRQVAKDAGAITAQTDEVETTIPEVMAHFVAQLTTEEAPQAFVRFVERYESYRKYREKIGVVPGLVSAHPERIAKPATHELIETYFDLNELSDLCFNLGIDYESLAGARKRDKARDLVAYCQRHGRYAELLATCTQLRPHVDWQDKGIAVTEDGLPINDWEAYLRHRLPNRQVADLVLAPVSTLTPLFIEGLRNLASVLPVVLICDTYEETAEFLDEWWCSVLLGKYGDLPVEFALVIAGRYELDRVKWQPLDAITARLQLEPFSKTEVLDYLSSKGIHSEGVISHIMEISGGLPLLVATLAAGSPHSETQLEDTSGTAVDRFLRWVDEPERRLVAMNMALPRTFNEDVMAVIQPQGDESALFKWLIAMPFVTERRDGWKYHELVRSQILRSQRRKSPQNWINLHENLLAYYTNNRAQLGLDREKGLRDALWQRYTQEIVYHRLCASPQKYLVTVLMGFLDAQRTMDSFMSNYIAAVRQAVEDTGNDSLRFWQKKLQATNAIDGETRNESRALIIETVLNSDQISSERKAEALGWRGEVYRVQGQLKEALAYLDEAIEMAPDSGWLRASRGATLRNLDRFDEALAEFEKALSINAHDPWTYIQRSIMYRKMGDFEKALADAEYVLEQSPQDGWALSNRGEIYRRMGNLKAALQDFDLSLKLEPDEPWVLACRGETYHKLQRYDEAFSDFNKAIAIWPDFAWAYANRGIVYRKQGRFKEALSDLDYAISVRPDYRWAIIQRAETYRQMQKHEERVADLTRAMELSDEVPLWMRNQRGTAYLRLGKYQQAISDFNAALVISPRHRYTLSQRGEAYLSLGNYDAAITDFSQALEYAKKLQVGTLVNRAIAYRELGSYEKAQNDFDQALQRRPRSSQLLSMRALNFRYKGDYTSALVDLNRALALEPEDAQILVSRGITYTFMGRYEEAKADFERALTLDPHDSWALSGYGRLQLLQGNYATTLSFYDRLLKRFPDADWVYLTRALACLGLDQEAAAQTDLQKVQRIAESNIDLDPSNWQSQMILVSFYLTQDDGDTALQIIKSVLAKNLPHGRIRDMLLDIRQILLVQPENEPARTIRELLAAHLEEQNGK